MKKILSLILIINIILCGISVYATPEDNFEYIDYPDTKYIYSAENGYVFHMLDGSKIVLDAYGNQTNDIVGVMGQNVLFFDDETIHEHILVEKIETDEGTVASYRVDSFETLYLYANNNKLITKLSTKDYEVVERDNYIVVSNTTAPIETRTFTIYSKIDGNTVSTLSAQNYIIGNTFYQPTVFDLTYWHSTRCGYFPFSDKEGLCGISDIKGNIIVEPKFTSLEVCDTERDLFMAKSDNGIYIIDKDGNITKELDFTGIAQVSSGNEDLVRYTASKGNGMGIPLDKDFNKLDFYDKNYNFLWALDNDHFVVEYADSYNKPKAMRGIMNSKGEIVLSLEYKTIQSIGNGLVQAYNSIGNQTLSDFDGNIIVENCNYITEVGDNGYIGIGILNSEGKREFEGYIDKSGKRVITLPDGHSVQGPFREGKAAIVDDWNAPFGRYGGSTVYINESGNVIINDPNQEWYQGEEFKNNIALVANNLNKSGAYGWLLIRYIGDTPSDWAEPSINLAIEKNLLPTDEPFNLNSLYHDSITREEFCILAMSIIKSVSDKRIDSTPTSFTDTDNEAIIALYNAGIIEGKSKTSFAPKDLLTREEAAKILNAVYTYLDIEHPYKNKEYAFADHNDISNWAKHGVYNMNAAGIMLGIGNDKFLPLGNYTREQAIVTFMRIYDASQK